MHHAWIGFTASLVFATACGGEDGTSTTGTAAAGGAAGAGGSTGSGGGDGGAASSGGAGGAPTGNCMLLDADACAARPDCQYAAPHAPDSCEPKSEARCYTKSDCNEVKNSCASEQECSEILYDCVPGDCASCSKFYVCSDVSNGA